VSWSSICARLALGLKCEYVRDCVEPHFEVKQADSLFSVIPDIIQNEYVLVRGKDNRITGIVTVADLSKTFLELSVPFLLIGEIEQHVKRLLYEVVSPEDIVEISNDQTQNKRGSVIDLTLGEIVLLVQKEDIWNKLKLPKIDRKLFVQELDKIRLIRNDV